VSEACEGQSKKRNAGKKMNRFDEASARDRFTDQIVLNPASKDIVIPEFRSAQAHANRAM
jgi:hypothetical protein